jgi:hypothetical protein
MIIYRDKVTQLTVYEKCQYVVVHGIKDSLFVCFFFFFTRKS